MTDLELPPATDAVTDAAHNGTDASAAPTHSAPMSIHDALHNDPHTGNSDGVVHPNSHQHQQQQQQQHRNDDFITHAETADMIQEYHADTDGVAAAAAAAATAALLSADEASARASSHYTSPDAAHERAAMSRSGTSPGVHPASLTNSAHGAAAAVTTPATRSVSAVPDRVTSYYPSTSQAYSGASHDPHSGAFITSAAGGGVGGMTNTAHHLPHQHHAGAAVPFAGMMHPPGYFPHAGPPSLPQQQQQQQQHSHYSTGSAMSQSFAAGMNAMGGSAAAMHGDGLTPNGTGNMNMMNMMSMMGMSMMNNTSTMNNMNFMPHHPMGGTATMQWVCPTLA